MFDSTAACVQALRQFRLLSPAQLDEVNANLRDFPQPRVLAAELLKAGWLTPYQVNQLFNGRGRDLVLGPYVLTERLGEGGAGAVYKARHVYMQRTVAIKFIRADMTDNTEIVGRFYREIQAVSQLVHPNVVLAHDAGPSGQTHFLAMEYVEGNDLQKMVTKTGAMPVDKACDYIRQAAMGLQHIHERGLIHRDIKPGNLLVMDVESGFNTLAPNQGQSYPYGLIKILDLGLARFDDPLNGNGGADPLTMAGQGGLRGSADYLAPEQAVDFHTADIRADIYSLGCVFYFLLAGKPPFDGSLALKLMKHQRNAPPPLEKVRTDLPRKLPQLVYKMMAKQPLHRYQTPGEVANALAAVHQRGWLGLWRG